MKFIKDLPNIIISQNDQYMFEIRSVQKFNEDENRVILKCAEEISEFKRGYVCDMECYFRLIENEENNEVGKRVDTVRDLVLVYINKNVEFGYVSDFEYVFYK
jgi:hypothetical protein